MKKVALLIFVSCLISLSSCKSSKSNGDCNEDDCSVSWTIILDDWIRRDIMSKSWQSSAPFDFDKYAQELKGKRDAAAAFGGPADVTLEIEFEEELYEYQADLFGVDYTVTVLWTEMKGNDPVEKSAGIAGYSLLLKKNAIWHSVEDTSKYIKDWHPLDDRDNLAQLVARGSLEDHESMGFTRRRSGEQDVLVEDRNTDKYYLFKQPAEEQYLGTITLLNRGEYLELYKNSRE